MDVHSQAVSDPPTAANRRRAVLVVEDDASIADLMRRLLDHYEFDVKAAGFCREAIQALHPELSYLILDLSLPDGDGINVLRAVRHRGYATRVAVVTGERDPQRLASVRMLRPNLLLPKPVDFLVLLEDMRA